MTRPDPLDRDGSAFHVPCTHDWVRITPGCNPWHKCTACGSRAVLNGGRVDLYEHRSIVKRPPVVAGE